jgi:hypothetical protein
MRACPLEEMPKSLLSKAYVINTLGARLVHVSARRRLIRPGGLAYGTTDELFLKRRDKAMPRQRKLPSGMYAILACVGLVALPSCKSREAARADASAIAAQKAVQLVNDNRVFQSWNKDVSLEGLTGGDRPLVEAGRRIWTFSAVDPRDQNLTVQIQVSNNLNPDGWVLDKVLENGDYRRPPAWLYVNAETWQKIRIAAGAARRMDASRGRVLKKHAH